MDATRLQRDLTIAQRTLHDPGYAMRGVALVQGTLRVKLARLAAIEAGTEPASLDFYNNRFWMIEVGFEGVAGIVGSREPSARHHVFVHEGTAKDDLLRLRQLDGRRVWFLVSKDGGLLEGCQGLHLAEGDDESMHAVARLLEYDLESLVRPVAERDAAVEAIVDDLRAQRIKPQAAVDRLLPIAEQGVPGLLHAMSGSLRTTQPGEFDANRPCVLIHGYNAEVRCIFDVLSVVAQNVRDFQSGGHDNDDARRADLRAFAIWQHLRVAAAPR
jgi:hypothetical protein